MQAADRSLGLATGLVILVTVLALGPSIFQPSLLLGLLVALSAGLIWQDRRLITRLSWPLWLGILGIALIGSALAFLPKNSLRETNQLLLAMLSMAAVFTVLRHTPNQLAQRRGYGMITAVAFSLLVVMLMAIGTTSETLNLRYNTLIFRWTSGIHEIANILSNALLILIVFWRNRVYTAHRATLWPLMLGLLLGGMLVLTNSRGAYVALLPAVLYAFFPSNKLVWGVVGLTWLGEIAAWLEVEILNPSTTDFLGYAFNGATIERVMLSRNTWDAIAQHPWLGYGLNSFKALENQLHIPLSQVMPHNIMLEVMFSVGIGGALIWLIALGVTCWRAAAGQTLQPSQSMYRQIAVALAIYLSLRGLTELHLAFRYYLSWATIMGFWLAAYYPAQRVLEYETNRLRDDTDDGYALEASESAPSPAPTSQSSSRFKRF